MAGKKKTTTNQPPGKTVAVNRKARFEYFIEEEIEAGIVLTGTEVKSLRAGRATINEAYAGAKGEEIWLYNATIAEYAQGNRMNHEPRRARKLLLHRRQIGKLIGRLKTKGITLIPLSLYFNRRGLAKIMLGLAMGKKQYEKRDTIKKREWEREKGRIMRNKNG